MKSSRVLFLILALASSAPAFAREPTKEEQAAAKEHFEEAQKQYKLGRFEDAFGEYQAAYELAPFADLLFNMGQCKRNLKEYERALFFFKSYMRDAPRAEDRARVNQLIAQLEDERRREAKTARPVDTSSTAVATALPKVETETSTPQQRIVVAPPIEEDDPLYREWWFWTAIAVVAAAAIGGTVAATSRGSVERRTGTIGTIDGTEE